MICSGGRLFIHSRVHERPNLINQIFGGGRQDPGDFLPPASDELRSSSLTMDTSEIGEWRFLRVLAGQKSSIHLLVNYMTCDYILTQLSKCSAHVWLNTYLVMFRKTLEIRGAWGASECELLSIGEKAHRV